MEITIQTDGHKGAAKASFDHTIAGMMTFTLPNDQMIIIDHTEVDPSHQGKSVGKLLLYKIVAMAREDGLSILPLCPFAKAMFLKYEDIQDVLKK